MDVDRRSEKGAGKIEVSLQWSHVLMDVDSLRALERARQKERASMEPRPDGRG